MSIASQNMRLMMSCDQALLGKLIRSLGFFGCCEMCRLMVRASPQHLLHWATSAVDWLSALEWQCLEAQVMDELSHCIRQPCKWRHSSEKKKTNRKTNVVAQKQQARLEGATAHHRSMQEGRWCPHLPLVIGDQPQTLWAQKRRQNFTHYGATTARQRIFYPHLLKY